MDWTTWKGATCLPDCWCEATRTGSLILEPVNTWSNLFFVFAGIYFVLSAKKWTDSSNKLNSDKIFPKIYGLGLIFLGFGSFFYHASQTFVGQWFDVFGMYLVSVFYFYFNLFRIDWVRKSDFLKFYGLTCLVLGLVIFYFPLSRRWLFGVILFLTLVQTVWIQAKSHQKINQRFLYSALGCYAFAQTVWLLDKSKIWCDPYGWINGHGLWHVFTGLAAVLFYFYFKSEKTQI